MKKTGIVMGSILLVGCSVAIEPLPSKGPFPAADPIIVHPPPIKTGMPANTVVEAPAPVIKSAKPEEAYYIVKEQDTLFEVMRQTGVHWKTIAELNDLQTPNYLIYPGQRLRIQ